jgi:hypothetical protein
MRILRLGWASLVLGACGNHSSPAASEGGATASTMSSGGDSGAEASDVASSSSSGGTGVLLDGSLDSSSSGGASGGSSSGGNGSSPSADGGGSGSVVGSICNATMTVQSTIAGVTSTSPGNFPFVTEIVMYSYPNACSLMPDPDEIHNSQIFWLYLVTSSALTARTLTVVPAGTVASSPGGAAAYYTSFDATCKAVTDQATSGSVVITTVSSTEIAGTFDITFTAFATSCDAGGSDHVTGTFVAPLCPALSASLLPSGAGDGGPKSCD